MNRFEQRLQKRLRDDEISAGYREMEAELALIRAIDTIRKDQHMSQEKLASRMGRKREAVARLFIAEDANPTLNTLVELLSALNITADITLRQSQTGEAPLKVNLQLPSSWQQA